MELLADLIDVEIRNILSSPWYTNTINTGQCVFTFNKLDEGVVFYFNDKSLNEIEKSAWVDINSNTVYEIKTSNELATKYRSFTTLSFNNKPIRIYIPFIIHKSTEPKRMVATEVQYYGWLSPFVSKWTEIKERQTESIDEYQLKEDLKKAKHSFIENVNNRMYLNSLYKTYKKSQEVC